MPKGKQAECPEAHGVAVRIREEEEAKQYLESVAQHWDRVVEFMQDSEED